MSDESSTPDAPALATELRELAYWAALVAANVACLGLMVLLLFR